MAIEFTFIVAFRIAMNNYSGEPTIFLRSESRVTPERQGRFLGIFC
jgi:hypothetical protein